MKIAYLVRARPDLVDLIPPDIEYVIVEAGPGGVYRDEDLAKVADADAFVISMEPVTEQLLAAAPRVRIAQRLGVGYETIDLEACAQRQVYACNVEGVNKEAVAEHVMLMMLALAKNLPEQERATRACDWPATRRVSRGAFELMGKTLGIIGFGNTGSQVARRARAFGMKILYNDIRPIDPAVLDETGAVFAEKDELLAHSDVVSINTWLDAGTRHMVDAAALARMQRHALLVFCSRGGVVDEHALRAALDAGTIAGAGVDVFEVEPITADNPLLEAPNCILTGHVAGLTEDSTMRCWQWAHDNVRAAVERGERPRWVLNGVD